MALYGASGGGVVHLPDQGPHGGAAPTRESMQPINDLDKEDAEQQWETILNGECGILRIFCSMLRQTPRASSSPLLHAGISALAQ